ncbi:MAG: hypothetical protein ACOX6O_06075 [Christensenellales bacterium]
MKRLFCALICIIMMLGSVAAFAEAIPLPELPAGITEKREVTSGAIKWSDDLAKSMLLEFMRATTGNYREMYSFSSTYNDVPKNVSLELTLDPEKFIFYGTTAKDSGKIMAAEVNDTVAVSWVKQLRYPEESPVAEGGLDWNYYDSYGLQFDAKVEVFTEESMDDPEQLKRLIDLLDHSLVTIKEWKLLWTFDENLSEEELWDAKVAAARRFMSYEDAYIVTPEEIVTIGYYMRPVMITDKNAWAYADWTMENREYVESQTNCVVFAKEETRYPFFDTAENPAGSEGNLLDKTIAYKNAMLEDPDTQAAIDALYGTEETITYNTINNAGEQVSITLPNWNRIFAMEPDNMCGLVTRQTIDLDTIR